MDVEVFSLQALEQAWQTAELTSEREHVTPKIWKNSTAKNKSTFVSYSFENEIDYSNYRLTVDSQQDFEFIEVLVDKVGKDKPWLEYVSFIKSKPKLTWTQSGSRAQRRLYKITKKGTSYD